MLNRRSGIPTRVAILFLICSFPYASVFSQSLSTRLDRHVTELVKRSEFSGAVLVARNGKVILSKGYGMADYEHSIANTPNTKFRIGSLTKPFTALATMMLYQQGKLKLQDNVCTYIKACPSEWAGVTIYHLLTHTSGVPNLFGEMEAVPVEQTAKEIDRVIASAVPKTLGNKPGEKYSYSNFGYCLLGYIIEKASGELYASFLNNHIFRPLGMIGSLYDDPRPIIKDRADGYVRKEGRLINDAPKDPAGYSAGGLLSTVEDFLRLDQALYANSLLSSNALAQMFTPFKNEYGLGWKVTTQFDRRVFNHNGGTHGFTSHVARYPDDRLLIVVLSNMEKDTEQGLACDLAEIVFGLNQKPIQLDKEVLGKYVGEYAFPNGPGAQIKLVGSNLVYEGNSGSYTMVPLARDLFRLESFGGMRIRFVFDNGAARIVRTYCGKEHSTLNKR